MIPTLFLKLVSSSQFITLYQFELPEFELPEEWQIDFEFTLPSLTLWIFSWIFLFIGLIALMVLIIYTKYGRELSIRLSIIAIVISSICLGFSFHFFLLNFGY